MLETKNTLEEEFDIDLILKDFHSACKHADDFKTGVEYERLPIRKDYKTVGYEGENGLYELLREFAKLDNWEYITDDYNIIGLSKGSDRISLEPGCQLELSLGQEKSISAIKSKVDSFNKKITPLLRKREMTLLEYGISPVSTYKNIKLIPKKRYHIMADYLWGILSDVMMRETAGIQACYDFSSEEDAMEKFRLACKLSPVMTAMFANSPIRGGVDTGYKTFRGLSWLNTDYERCGFPSKKLFDKKYEYSFKEYIQDVMKTPMIYITRYGKAVEIDGKINFEQFLKSGWQGFKAKKEDFDLHANLFFPEVRLRNFIEIRNHDCVNHGMQYSILAIYKGILYNKDAFKSAEELLDKFNYNDIMELRYNVPRKALNTKIRKISLKDIAKEVLQIAQKGLRENGGGEEKFLEPIMEFTPYGISPADLLLRHWNGSWDKDMKKMIGWLSN